MRTVNHAGQTFGRWTLIIRTASDKDKAIRWLCCCECGTRRTVRIRSLRTGLSKSCGCLNRELVTARTGQLSPGWRGGKTTTESGYVLVQAPENPAAQQTGYVPEHRLVMESVIGRSLYPEETVHHKNGIRSDNRPENLELWTSRQPKGQRVADLVVWAKEILALYGAVE